MRHKYVGATLVLLLLTACGNGSSSSEGTTLKVRYLVDSGWKEFAMHTGEDCTMPYIGTARILVKNASGTTVATKTIEPPATGTILVSGPEHGPDCNLGVFTIGHVPDSNFYTVSQEDLTGDVTVSKQELASNDGVVDLLVPDPLEG